VNVFFVSNPVANDKIDSFNYIRRLGSNPLFGISYDTITFGCIVPFQGIHYQYFQFKATYSNFTTTKDTFFVGEQIQFTDSSVLHKLNKTAPSDPDIHTWNFGDGTTQTNILNPTYAYSDTGNFTVSLTSGTSQMSGTLVFTDNVSKQITIIDTAHTVVDTTQTGIFSPTQSTTEILTYHKRVTINSETDIKQIEVFNVMGQVVTRIETLSNRLNFSLNALDNGIYIIVLTDQKGAVTSKKILLQ
jgi:PKD repeat protein